MPKKIYKREDFATEKEWQNRLRMRRNSGNYMKRKYKSMTPQEKEAHIIKQTEAINARTAAMTPEEKEAHRQYVNEKNRKSKKKNKKKLRLRRIADREKINAWSREYYKNPHRKIAHSLRNRLGRIVTSKKKSANTEALLGCKFSEFKLYLEGFFQPGMSWETYGKEGWSIDHIKPLAAFDNLANDPAQQRECCHYTNLRPMWESENLSKNSWWEGVLIRRKKPKQEKPLDTPLQLEMLTSFA